MTSSSFPEAQKLLADRHHHLLFPEPPDQKLLVTKKILQVTKRFSFFTFRSQTLSLSDYLLTSCYQTHRSWMLSVSPFDKRLVLQERVFQLFLFITTFYLVRTNGCHQLDFFLKLQSKNPSHESALITNKSLKDYRDLFWHIIKESPSQQYLADCLEIFEHSSREQMRLIAEEPLAQVAPQLLGNSSLCHPIPPLFDYHCMLQEDLNTRLSEIGCSNHLFCHSAFPIQYTKTQLREIFTDAAILGSYSYTFWAVIFFALKNLDNHYTFHNFQSDTPCGQYFHQLCEKIPSSLGEKRLGWRIQVSEFEIRRRIKTMQFVCEQYQALFASPLFSFPHQWKRDLPTLHHIQQWLKNTSEIVQELYNLNPEDEDLKQLSVIFSADLLCRITALTTLLEQPNPSITPLAILHLTKQQYQILRSKIQQLPKTTLLAFFPYDKLLTILKDLHLLLSQLNKPLLSSHTHHLFSPPPPPPQQQQQQPPPPLPKSKPAQPLVLRQATEQVRQTLDTLTILTPPPSTQDPLENNEESSSHFPISPKYRDLVKYLKKNTFTHISTHGSHMKFLHQPTHRTLILPCGGKLKQQPPAGMLKVLEKQTNYILQLVHPTHH